VAGWFSWKRRVFATAVFEAVDGAGLRRIEETRNTAAVMNASGESGSTA
jgi:hypothetical protein